MGIYVAFLDYLDKPGKPQGPVIFKEIRQDRVTLEWRPPADDGGIELEKYTIEKCEPGKAWVKVVDIDKEVESFCVHKLQQNAEYNFRIIARNAVGVSEPLESDVVKMRTSFGEILIMYFLCTVPIRCNHSRLIIGRHNAFLPIFMLLPSVHTQIIINLTLEAVSYGTLP